MSHFPVMKNKSIVNVTKGFIYQQQEYNIIHSSQTSRGGMNINVYKIFENNIVLMQFSG